MARKWTDVQGHECEIEAMRKKGMTRKEIADELGFSLKQIENHITRYNKRQRSEIPPKRRGRPHKALQTLEGRIAELEREVTLLRSFLHVAGRM